MKKQIVGLLVGILGCVGSISAQSLEGYWGNNNAAVKIIKSGDLYRITYKHMNVLDEQSFAGRFEKGEIQLGSGPCSKLSYLADTKKILFCGEEFKKFSELKQKGTEDVEAMQYPKVVRSVNDALALMGIAKTAVAETYLTSKKMPNNNHEANIGQPSGNISVTVQAGGVISAPVNMIWKGTMQLIPTSSGTSINWRCIGKDVPKMYLPASCGSQN